MRNQLETKHIKFDNSLERQGEFLHCFTELRIQVQSEHI